MVSVFALWCPLAIPTVLVGFLLPWMWGISSCLLQQSAGISPYLGWGVSPHCRPSWPSMWDSSSRPSCAHAATAPWMWGWSSQTTTVSCSLGGTRDSREPAQISVCGVTSSKLSFVKMNQTALGISRLKVAARSRGSVRKRLRGGQTSQNGSSRQVTPCLIHYRPAGAAVPGCTCKKLY